MNKLPSRGRFAQLAMTSFACLALSAAPAAFADPVTLSFNNLTTNSAVDTAAGEAQLSVVVSSGPSGTVDFTFHNVGAVSMFISDIYFDDGTIIGAPTIFESAGVDFELGANPDNITGHNNISPAFEASLTFNTSADDPQPTHGVNNTLTDSETVTLRFELQGSLDFDDTIAALNNGDLRVGIKVQGFPLGGSEAFVANPPGTPGEGVVPLPAVAWGGLALFGGLGMNRRRRI